MRRIFTSTIFVAALAVASFNSNAQTTCTAPTTCSGANAIVTDFNSGAGGFTASGSMSYSGTDFRNTVFTAGGYSATLTSGMYIKTATLPNAVAAGFVLSTQTKITVSNVRLNIVDNGNNVIAFCDKVNPADGQLCFGVSNPAIVNGLQFHYQFVITYSSSGGNSSNSTITFDNFGYSTVSNAALPVKFQTLDAKAVNSGVSLKWNVATEEDLSGYSIERSTDGRNFAQIAFVGANGQSNYSFVDNKAGSVSYYRIKSVDINGRYGYSTVALVKSGQSMIVLKAFPSPVIKSVSIQHPTAIAGSSITISSADGRVIKTIVPAAGMQQTEVDLSAAKAGLYLVRYNSGNGASETLKVLKQ